MAWFRFLRELDPGHFREASFQSRMISSISISSCSIILFDTHLKFSLIFEILNFQIFSNSKLSRFITFLQFFSIFFFLQQQPLQPDEVNKWIKLESLLSSKLIQFIRFMVCLISRFLETRNFYISKNYFSKILNLENKIILSNFILESMFHWNIVGRKILYVRTFWGWSPGELHRNVRQKIRHPEINFISASPIVIF